MKYNDKEWRHPLSCNAGFLLCEIGKTIPLNKIEKDDGLFYIFKNIYIYASIDISDFYPDSPLVQFFTKNRDFIEINIKHYTCWIKMVLENHRNFAYPNEDIKLLLAHPYFSVTGKMGMLESLIVYCRNHLSGAELLLDCRQLIISSHQELIEAFEIALKESAFNFAIHLFCQANQLDMPKNFIISWMVFPC